MNAEPGETNGPTTNGPGRRNEHVGDGDVVAARAPHAQRVPVVDDRGLLLRHGEQQQERRAVRAELRLPGRVEDDRHAGQPVGVGAAAAERPAAGDPVATLDGDRRRAGTSHRPRSCPARRRSRASPSSLKIWKNEVITAAFATIHPAALSTRARASNTRTADVGWSSIPPSAVGLQMRKKPLACSASTVVPSRSRAVSPASPPARSSGSNSLVAARSCCSGSSPWSPWMVAPRRVGPSRDGWIFHSHASLRPC